MPRMSTEILRRPKALTSGFRCCLPVYISLPEASGDGSFFVHNSMPEVGWRISVHSVWSNRDATGDGSFMNFHCKSQS